ncbi:hypothetical protein SOVF_052600 isoform A [Spinacia oleracea]|uniref:AB hydrolase-1 domain-containing protein n=1 Tax=Spinacia oleracea TaxID=3562 RepID=A0A9R0JAC8_SPIOL|nr:uncharacterized protein LOC110802995 [Spinacia oleracea]KNA20414.1 hypothetical protein SOVF_052600 isoform A [Spinacia oleracea]
MAIFIPSQINPNPTLFSPSTSHLLHSTFRNREFRLWRKRRLKRNSKLLLPPRNALEPSSAFDFLSLLPPTLNWVPPAAALGFASAFALSISNLKPKNPKSSSNLDPDLNSRVADIGEWILFSSPTPFNRFVLLRCPSISFEGGGGGGGGGGGEEYAEDVSERLVKEEKHYVRLDSGRIQLKSEDGGGKAVEGTENGGFEYQRVCIGTDDGGVLSLDWPSKLDLREERGLDTTVLLIPGTAKGSMDDNVRSVVRECLRRGLFPVVMNPRGCAGSPLTTARLFTAADSDDICSAIQFITKARPWSTFTGVGWGYGANMLTKYLAEAGEKTPLTAATCIDNPFDLDEATRTSPYCYTIDNKLTEGLIDILKSNKQLFQGRRKGFDVEKALSAESVRDFEKAISMVSYGFDTIEDFYSNSSTRKLVGNLKVPVLFVQNDNGIAPLFSIPRGSIAENPFTSLLLCSCLPSNVTAISWYEHVAMEWLTAVELGLLKGRHPLLQDIDVAVNPSIGLALVEGKTSDTSSRPDRLLNLAKVDGSETSDAYMDPMKEMLIETDAVVSIPSKFNQNSLGSHASGTHGDFPHGSTKDENPATDMEASPVEGEPGQVLPTAQLVMNMLDVSMPGTLKEEDKKKVLSAVGKGETLMTALQDAVPEDVRGKLTASVSEIMQAPGKNLNLDLLPSVNQKADASSDLKSKNKENAALQSESKNENAKTDQVGEEAIETRSPKESVESDIPESKEGDSHDDDKGLTKSSNDSQNTDEKLDNVGQLSESGGDGSETASELNSSSRSAGGTNSEADVVSGIRSQDDGKKQKENDISERVEEPKDLTDEQNKSSSAADSPADKNEVTSPPISDGQMSEKGDNDSKTEEPKDLTDEQNKTSSAADSPADTSEVTSPPMTDSQMSEKGDDVNKTEGENLEPVPDQNRAPFSVTQAFDALTGFDDSTQMAVNSVFGVLEDMITQLEEKNNESIVNEGVENKDATEGSVIEKDNEGVENKDATEGSVIEKDNEGVENKDANEGSVIEKDNEGVENKDATEGSVIEKDCSNIDLQLEKQTDGEKKEDTNHQEIESVNGHDSNSGVKNSPTYAAGKENNILIVSKPGAAKENVERMTNISKDSFYIKSNPYVTALDKEFLPQFILTKMRKMNCGDVDATTLLDCVPENGHLLLLKQPGGTHVAVFDSKDIKKHSKLPRKGSVADNVIEPKEHSKVPQKGSVTDNVIEPTYFICDKDGLEKPVEESMKKLHDKSVEDNNLDKSIFFVKTTLLNSLKVEVSRRLNAVDTADMDANLAADMEAVADAVYLAIQHDVEHNQKLVLSGFEPDFQEWSRHINGNRIIEVISKAVQDTSYLKKVLPVGVIVGSILAALRNCFDLSAGYCDSPAGSLDMDQDQTNVLKPEDLPPQEVIQVPTDGIDHDLTSGKNISRDKVTTVSDDQDDQEMAGFKGLNGDTLMAGAFTAALGASAFLTSQEEDFMANDGCESEDNRMKSGTVRMEETVDGKDQSNIVTSFAEKAMSVAGPVIPTTENGAVDQERIVAMLVGVGERGGMLRLVSKLALLWGGLRGAMSLTDRLFSFLRIVDQPLLLRVLGFSCMVLVLWSPVLLPLLPTLLQNLLSHNSSRIVELACVVGLYAAVTILIMQWGKGIRGYEYPLKQYGLDFTSPKKVQHFLIGLAGGVMLVVTIHSLNAYLGLVNLSFPSSLGSSSLTLSAKIKAHGQLFLSAGQAILVAAGVAFVEELLFRSWLLEEIAIDLGYHPGILLSGLAFALSQRSWEAIPGLWLLSMCLAGARLRKEGSLFIPIGVRTGLIASSYVLQSGGFVVYTPKFPWWVVGMHPFQPFCGVVGLLFALLLAVALYPRQLVQRERIPRKIRA